MPLRKFRPYRFNGKESQEFAGLPYLDYGARFYHPLSSRWTTMDPMSEKYYSVSLYAFCSNNPVNFAHSAEYTFTQGQGDNAKKLQQESPMDTGKRIVSHINKMYSMMEEIIYL